MFKLFFKHGKNYSTDNSGFRYLKRIISGPKVIIDGKVFVRVKLRFVDTLDFNTTRFIDQLETEIESQKTEIDRLSSILTNNEKLINDLQTLNIYLLYENRKKPVRLSEKISALSSENLKKSKKVSSMEDQFLKQKDKNNQLNGQITKLQKQVAEKDNMIKSMGQTITWLQSSESSAISILHTNTRLRNELKTYENTLKTHKQERKHKDLLIKSLTKRIHDNELKIMVLESRISENQK